MPYLKDNDNTVYCLDSEGAPLKLSVRQESLHSGEGAVIQTDFAKTPMSGTVVKVFCSVGQELKQG